VRIRVGRRSTIALAAAAGLASTGTVYVGARNLLSGQADQARQVIPKSWDIPPRADGVYSAGGGPVEKWRRGMPFDLHLMVFGDSTAAGYGCQHPDELPGVLIARGLAEESGRRVRLSTKAIVGATSKGLSGQIDAMFVAGPPPGAAVIMIGANDITKPNGIGPSARRLGRAVRRLRASGAVVVVGTCPDFGLITDSAAAALDGPQPRVAPGPFAGLGGQIGRRCARTVLRSVGARLPQDAGSAVQPGHVSSVGRRICLGGQPIAACARKSVGRVHRSPDARESIGIAIRRFPIGQGRQPQQAVATLDWGPRADRCGVGEGARAHRRARELGCFVFTRCEEP